MSINYFESILAISESQAMALDTTKLVNNSLAELLTDKLPIAFLDIMPISTSAFLHHLDILNIKDADEDDSVEDGGNLDDDDFDDDFDDDDFDDDDLDDDDFDDDFDDSDFYEDDFDDDEAEEDFEDDAEEDEEGSWDDSF